MKNHLIQFLIGLKRKRKITEVSSTSEEQKHKVKKVGDLHQGSSGNAQIKKAKTKQFKNSSRHWKTGQSMECSKCDRKFASLGYLVMHMKKHNHPCPQCEASFKTELSLQVHPYFILANSITNSCSFHPSPQ